MFTRSNLIRSARHGVGGVKTQTSVCHLATLIQSPKFCLRGFAKSSCHTPYCRLFFFFLFPRHFDMEEVKEKHKEQTEILLSTL